jgi:23S rRNA (pseudouridine1915-N3)-methyltransferase
MKESIFFYLPLCGRQYPEHHCKRTFLSFPETAMVKIRILAVGRKAAGWLAEAEKHYLQRLGRYADAGCELIAPLDEHALGDARCTEQESALLNARCRPEECIIACDPKGKSFSSEQLAAALGQLQDRGAKICVVIGGSHGLSQALLAKAHLAVSFSRLTFPHELFRIMLLEQLYRAFTILAGKKYHK